MILLVDSDSLIYTSLFKIYSFSEIKSMIKEFGKEKTAEEIVSSAIFKFENQCMEIIGEISSYGFDVEDIEYFMSMNSQCWRKKRYPDYKANRPKTTIRKWVRKVKEALVSDTFYFSEEWEADDLIYDRAKELGGDKCIITSMDKDLLTLPFIVFDFYRGGGTAFRGLKFNTQEEHEYFFAYQMLAGDTSDNIKGIKGIGKVKARKILEGKKGYSMAKAVIQAYPNRQEARKNYNLLKLGTR